MKDSYIKKAVIAIGVVAAMLVIVVVAKFFMIDPAKENDRLNATLAEKDATIASLRVQVSKLKGDVESLDGTIDELKEQVKLLEKQNKDQLGDLNSSFQKQIDALRSDISSLEKQKSELEAKLEKSENNVASLEETIKSANAAKNTAYTNVLATFSTAFSYADEGRVTNLTVASHSLTGSIIMPGETFSFFDVVGECTVPKGYRESKIFLQGEISEGIGGGICQVSSTLYNAALLSGMKIVERHNHSMKVSYIQPGRDATVSYGYMDLKFKNPYDSPVKIIAEVENGKLTFTFLSEYKKIKVPEIKIDVTVNRDGDYVTERTLGGTVDLRTVSHYTK